YFSGWRFPTGYCHGRAHRAGEYAFEPQVYAFGERPAAHLARLEFDPAREEQMLKDLNGILDWVDQLAQVDTTGVEPLVHLSHEINVLRDDEARNTVTHQEGLRNAPRKDSDYFRVPKVLD
nr:hypothetical protein [Tanacetum cinerariifolium]